ncbi:MAG: hypothetical protein U0525_04295 [Patescibacteria group bacterium]
MRNSLQVVDSLIVKGHPNASTNSDLKGRGLEQGEYDVFDALSKVGTILVEVSRSDGDPTRVMDKLYPHGLMELMLMQSARKQKASICDLHYPLLKAFVLNLWTLFRSMQI